jgi:hypothetical protein
MQKLQELVYRRSCVPRLVHFVCFIHAFGERVFPPTKLFEEARQKANKGLFILTSVFAVYIGQPNPTSLMQLSVKMIDDNGCHNGLPYAGYAMAEERRVGSFLPLYKLLGVKKPLACFFLAIGEKVTLLALIIQRHEPC